MAAQAEAEPNVKWLALELMRNRAHATAARLALAQQRNAATLSGDAAEALEKWLPPRSLSAVYCNHPEPPQQAPSASSKTAAPEAAHMLDGRLFDAAATALLPGGTLTIVVRPARIELYPPPLSTPTSPLAVTRRPFLASVLFLASLPHPTAPPLLRRTMHGTPICCSTASPPTRPSKV